jgi:general secretion pathway protein K
MSDRRKTRPSRQRGIALLGVLWVGVALGALAAAIISLSRSDVDLARNLRIRTEAQLAADSAVRVAIYAMINRADSVIAADGSIVAWRQPKAEVRLQATPEDSRVDLNRAQPELVAAVLQAAGADSDTAAQLAAAITDYADADDQVTPLGAERADYAAAGLPGPKNAAFESEDELLAVIGMPPELYRRAVDAFTVHSRRRAPKRGRQHPLVEAALEGDTAAAAVEAPLPAAFTEPLDATPQVLVPGDQSPRSGLVRIRAEVTTTSGAVAVRVAVVALVAGRRSRYAIRAWRSDRPTLFPG